MITKAQLEEYERLREGVLNANAALATYVDGLIAVCDHPEQYVQDYTWEHDNGYGRQTMITGKWCTICNAKKPWGSSYSWVRNGVTI